MKIGELRRVLRDCGVLGEVGGEPTPAELADVLWLAALRRSAQPALPAIADPPPVEDTQVESEDHGVTQEPAQPSQAGLPRPPAATQPAPKPAPAKPQPASQVLATLPVRGMPSSGVLVSAAARPQLLDSLALARAMRPLRRLVPSATRQVLDEIATADLRAEQGLWVPALAQGSEPAFDLALVVDDSESMALWGEKVREFRLLCERLGAFRDVRLWHLSATDDDAAGTNGAAKPVLRGPSGRSGARDERELVDPSGRRLILVVTDGVHPWWRPSGPLGPVLARWALASPLAIVQPFPQRLWERSPLRPVIEEFRPGWPGNGPTIRRLDPGFVAVPILELASAAMRRWTGIVSGTSGITRLPAVALSEGSAAEDQADGNVRPGHGGDAGEPDPAQVVRSFRASVSPAAYQLAGYLSAAPLTLPVMRLVQESMMPEAGPAELAEVFLSGLLRKAADSATATDADNASYVFAAGVRDVLQSTLTRDEALSVLDQVGGYLVRGPRGGRPFPVLLRGEPVGSDIAAAAEQFPAAFGRIVGPLLNRIGGPYADAIRRAATSTAPPREEPRGGRSPSQVPEARVAREEPEDVSLSPDAAHCEMVLRYMVQGGDLVPLLGSALTEDRTEPNEGRMPPPDAEAIAAYLAERFGIKQARLDLPEIAQYVYVTMGRPDLYRALGQILTADYEPGPVHRFLARFPRTLEELGLNKQYQLIVSANLDTALEQAFDEEHEPYDLAVYMASGLDKGKFVHFPAEGAPTAIDHPNSYTGFPIGIDYELARTVIVKIHGAVDGTIGDYRWRENYVITEDHFIDYLCKGPIESLVPVQILDKLRDSHCLFLGYAIRDWTQRVFLRRIWPGGRSGTKSWAVKNDADMFEQQFWMSSEVSLHKNRLTNYVEGLDRFLREHYLELR